MKRLLNEISVIGNRYKRKKKKEINAQKNTEI